MSLLPTSELGYEPQRGSFLLVLLQQVAEGHENMFVFICDPMLATGGSVCEVIRVCLPSFRDVVASEGAQYSGGTNHLPQRHFGSARYRTRLCSVPKHPNRYMCSR